MEQNTDEIEIDLLDIYYIIKKNILLIIFAASFVGLLAGLVSKYVVSEKYKSTAKLYIAKASTANLSVSNLLSGASSNDYTELAAIRPLVEAAIIRLELDETYESMMEKVSIEMPATYIMKITVVYDDPETAMLATNEMAEVVRQGIAEIVGIDVPQIIETGIVPTSPASPNILKNILAGMLAGGIGMAGIMVVAYLLPDRRKVDEDEDTKRKGKCSEKGKKEK